MSDAVSYNKNRKYTSSLWVEIQKIVGVPADGIPGTVTTEAIATWQGGNDLTPDGKHGPATLQAMQLGPFRQISDSSFRWLGKLSIDCDGGWNAYNPHDTGIDYLANAGWPGSGYGLSLDSSGQPYVQGDDDAYPGFYISTTAMNLSGYPADDPRRFVDSVNVEYSVLPSNIRDFVTVPVTKGDLMVVSRARVYEGMQFQQAISTVYADVSHSSGLTIGPDTVYGEGSVALARALGHNPYRFKSGTYRASQGISDAEIAFTYHANTRDGVEVVQDRWQTLSIDPDLSNLVADWVASLVSE